MKPFNTGLLRARVRVRRLGAATLLATLLATLTACTLSGSGTSPAKASVTVTQHHETNSFEVADHIQSFGGPCQPVTLGETGNFVGSGWAYDSPSLRLTSMYAAGSGGEVSQVWADKPQSLVGAHLTSFVTCLKPVLPIGFTQGVSGGVIPARATWRFEAVCVVGVPVMGAFIIQHGMGYIETFQRSTHGWVLIAQAQAAPLDVEVHALCERDRLVPAAVQPYSGVVVPPGQSASTSVACPAGSVLTGGGFDVPDGHGVIVTQNSPAAASDPSPGAVTGWHVRGFNFDGVDHVLYARAVCMTVDAADHPHATYVAPLPTSTPALTPSPTVTPTGARRAAGSCHATGRCAELGCLPRCLARRHAARRHGADRSLSWLACVMRWRKELATVLLPANARCFLEPQEEEERVCVPRSNLLLVPGVRGQGVGHDPSQPGQAHLRKRRGDIRPGLGGVVAAGVIILIVPEGDSKCAVG